MNKLKKGISLIAVTAFLITALVPVAGFATAGEQIYNDATFTVDGSFAKGGSAVCVVKDQATDITVTADANPGNDGTGGAANTTLQYNWITTPANKATFGTPTAAAILPNGATKATFDTAGTIQKITATASLEGLTFETPTADSASVKVYELPATGSLSIVASESTGTGGTLEAKWSLPGDSTDDGNPSFTTAVAGTPTYAWTEVKNAEGEDLDDAGDAKLTIADASSRTSKVTAEEAGTYYAKCVVSNLTGLNTDDTKPTTIITVEVQAQPTKADFTVTGAPSIPADPEAGTAEQLPVIAKGQTVTYTATANEDVKTYVAGQTEEQPGSPLLTWTWPTAATVPGLTNGQTSGKSVTASYKPTEASTTDGLPAGTAYLTVKPTGTANWLPGQAQGAAATPVNDINLPPVIVTTLDAVPDTYGTTSGTATTVATGSDLALTTRWVGTGDASDTAYELTNEGGTGDSDNISGAVTYAWAAVNTDGNSPVTLTGTTNGADLETTAPTTAGTYKYTCTWKVDNGGGGTVDYFVNTEAPTGTLSSEPDSATTGSWQVNQNTPANVQFKVKAPQVTVGDTAPTDAVGPHYAWMRVAAGATNGTAVGTDSPTLTLTGAEVNPLGPGTYYYVCRVSADGEEEGDVYAPVTVGPFTLTVTAEPTLAWQNPPADNAVTIAVGQELTLSTVLSPNTAQDTGYTWNVTGDSDAIEAPTSGSSGTLKGLAVGTASVVVKATVTGYTGTKDTAAIAITVVDDVADVITPVAPEEAPGNVIDGTEEPLPADQNLPDTDVTYPTVTVPVADSQDTANPPELVVDKVDGFTYEWTVTQTENRNDDVGNATQVEVARAGDTGTAPFQASVGSYVYYLTVKASDGTGTETVIARPVIIKGEIEDIAPANSATDPSDPGATVVDAAVNEIVFEADVPSVTSTEDLWVTPPPAPSANAVEYVWWIQDNGGQSGLTLKVNGAPKPRTDGAWVGDSTATTATLVGLNTTGSKVTVSCVPIVPGTYSVTDFVGRISGTYTKLAEPKSSTVSKVVSSLTGITNTTPNSVANGATNTIVGTIGERLQQTATATWTPPKTSGIASWRLVAIPNSDQLLGPAIAATKNPANQNLLTLTTAGALQGNNSASYTYTLQALAADGTQVDEYAPITLNLTLNKPTVAERRYYITSGVPKQGITVTGSTVVYVAQGQTQNLPVLEATATLEGAAAAGWRTTKWYISPTQDSVLPADATELTTGITDSGNRTSRYQVQPGDVAAVAASPATGNELYLYAVMQYGDNANCSVVTAPYTLKIATATDWHLYPLNEDGDPERGALRTATLGALRNSQTKVTLTAMWEPDMEPDTVTGYTWTYTQGPGSISINNRAATLPGVPTATVTTTVPTIDVSNFDGEGPFTITCTAVGKAGETVNFVINVGQISVGSNTDQFNSMAYWVQPGSGYFVDSSIAPTFNAGAYPTAQLGTHNTLLSIGNINGLSVTGQTPGGQTVPVALNGRFQLFFDPEGMTYANQKLSNDPTDPNYWANFVVLEWRYKTSQYNEDDGNSTKIPEGMGFSGVDSPLLTSGPLTSSMDGWQFALEIHDKKNENIYTTTRWTLLDLDGINPATQPVATITSFPQGTGSNVDVTVGSDVTFTASAQSSIPEADLTYQWQSKAPITSTTPSPQWTNIADATESTYSVSNLTAEQNDYSYRCIVTNTAYAGGVYVPSNEITLNVTAQNGSIVVEQPQAASLINLFAGRTLSTEVSARSDNGDEVSYQWYVKSFNGPVPTGNAVVETTDQAAALIAASGSQAIAGATSSALTTEPLQEGVYEFTCRVQNTTNAARVQNTPPVYVVVTENSRKPYISVPASSPVTSVGVTNGQAISLGCTAWVASGETLTYQWQTSRAQNGPWTDMTSTEPTLTLTNVTPTYTGSYYRCIVTNAAANEKSTSPAYLLNVWNVANVPSITAMSSDLEVPWDAGVSNDEIVLTSTMRVAQGADHTGITPMWTLPNSLGTVTPASSSPRTKVSLTNKTEAGYTTYTSTLTLTVADGSEDDPNAWRNYIGNYKITWFDNQGGNADSLAGTQVNQIQPANTTSLVAPQATSNNVKVQILISGTPAIVTTTAKDVTQAVGQTATFGVTALLNENADANPKGNLVYVWQMTKNGGATWNNCVSTDGTGQFTNTFTTATITPTMYDNSTASNVAGGTPVGNADTVYQYRCIVANRTTGAKAHTENFKLTITPGTVTPPTEAAITVKDGVSLTISDNEELGKIVSGTDLTVSKSGNPAGTVADMFSFVPEGADYELRLVNASDEPLADDAVVGTGCKVQLLDKANNDAVLQTVTIIVRGDVMGSGVISLTQLVRMAAALKDATQLNALYTLAGDLDGNGAINLTDLVQEAAIYRAEILDAGAEPTPAPSAEPTATPSAEPTATSSAEATATPSAEPTATPSAEPTATPSAEATATPSAEPSVTSTATPSAA